MKSSKKELTLYFGVGKEREYFIENLSFLISSGMPVVEGLAAVEGELKTHTMRKVVRHIREQVEDGSPLWRALENVGVFGGNAISLIRSGEDAGTLAENLRVISEQEAKNRIFKSKVRSALMYPVFVLTITGVVGISVSWFILPKLANVFLQLRVNLPAVTRGFIAFGQFLSQYGYIVVPSIIIFCVFSFYFLFYFPKTKNIGQRILLFMPGINQLVQEIEIARLGYLLGSLFKAGLPLLEAIDSLRESTLSPSYRKFYDYLHDSIEEGNSFQQSFKEYKGIGSLVPIAIQQIIVVGEQSGNLSEALLKVSTTYESKTEITSKNLAVVLEPLLLVVVWVGVVLVALAVVLPIYSLIGSINN
jgi:type II secretory pathway component PulF